VLFVAGASLPIRQWAVLRRTSHVYLCYIFTVMTVCTPVDTVFERVEHRRVRTYIDMHGLCHSCCRSVGNVLSSCLLLQYVKVETYTLLVFQSYIVWG
jgi:hypothetical protein